MAYTSYLVEKFETTHENRFFRELNDLFIKTFSEEDGDHVLVGNFSVRGHSLDAVFIRKGAIVVIDFKDYKGELTFSENGPWKLRDESGRMVFVAGGAKSRNPFQQVNAYRFAIFQYLSEFADKILDDNHTNVRWDHTNCMVLFHREISYIAEQIPDRIKRYFHISDYARVVDNLTDIHSNGLELTNTEIQKILDVLHVREDTQYTPEEVDDESEENTYRIDPARMDRIRQLIPDVDTESYHIPSLAYYNTMIGIERMNEASVSDISPYPIKWSNVDPSDFKINLENNAEFNAVYRKNRENRFSKNLFVSVDLLLDGIIAPLFYTVVMDSEIDDLSAIRVNFNGFILFRNVLNELQLTEDVIEELATIINDQDTLNNKISAARNFLDVPLELVDRISLGLSAESVFSAQLQSELGQWIRGRQEVQENKLFDSFLLKSKLTNDDVKFNGEFIQITRLNPSQKKSVALSFKQRLTVVTGPPGTGKSQVVTNILANAIYNNQKVLFASKNNQAVDNVHERISDILSTDYFLRLGTNEHNENLRSKLGRFIQEIRNGDFSDESQSFLSAKQSYQKLFSERRELKGKLASLPKLQNQVTSLNDEISSIQNRIATWQQEISDVHKELYLTNNESIKARNAELNSIEQQLVKARRGGLSGFVFNVFKKNATVIKIKLINKRQSDKVQTYLDNNAPMVGKGVGIVESLLANIRLLQKEKSIETTLKSTHVELNNLLEEKQQELIVTQKTLSEIQENQDAIRERIEQINKSSISDGRELLRLCIHEKIRNASIEFIDSYKGYLDNGLPWKSEEMDSCRAVINGFLDSFNTISITSLTVKKGFLLEPEIFDLLVIDEASQCDIASALPLIYRAKRIVVIGDPLQLPHITSVKKMEQSYVLEKLNLSNSNYNYVNDSLFSHADSISNRSGLESAFLKEHYRCHPDIIGFSNHYFYRLIAGQELTINTSREDFNFGEPGLHWIDVKGKVQENRNVNSLEVAACVKLAERLGGKFPDASIGIVTPFKHQKQALLEALSDLPGESKIVCDTVHRFQGDERDIMIMSLVVTNNSRPSLSDFINRYSPYILNVGVTRARSALYIVGNKNYCLNLVNNNGRTFLANLAQYETLVNS